MIMISAMHAQGTDLRPARNTDLVSLVQSQSRRNTELTRQLTGCATKSTGWRLAATSESDLASELSRAGAPRRSHSGLWAGGYGHPR